MLNIFEFESHTMSGLEKLGVGLEIKPVNFSKTLKWVNKIYTHFNVRSYNNRKSGTSYGLEMNKFQVKILNLLMNLCGLHSKKLCESYVGRATSGNPGRRRPDWLSEMPSYWLQDVDFRTKLA